MFISIIIPTFQEANYIGSMLDYLMLCPGNTQFEIIVADAGSEDQTNEIARSKNVTILNCPVRCRACQMNFAANRAKGDVLYFVHADTMPPAHFVSDITKAIRQGHDIGGYRFRFHPNNGLLRINSYLTRFNILAFRGGDQTIFISRKAWETLGGYDEKFVVMEEYDLLKRASNLGYKYHLMPSEVLVSNRKYHKNSWLRVNFANLVAMVLFRLNTPPIKIKKIYSSLLKNTMAGYQTS